MRILKFFLFSIFCFCPILCSANECSSNGLSHSVLHEYEVIGNKVYIQPEQLSIMHEGIYLIIQGKPVLVSQLNCDEKGIYCFIEYLDTISDKCYNGHKIWCTRCWGCVVRECNFHCKCVAWNK